MKISFIGYGNIAKAIATGLLNKNVDEIQAAAPSLSQGEDGDVRTFSDNVAVIENADVLILAVKPLMMKNVLTEINTRAKLPAHCLIISVASGLNLAWFEKYLPNMAIVRAMPNIALAVGKGATPMIANGFVTEVQKKRAEHVFANPGLVTWINNEKEINAFTALSGSGPAYIFLFMEAMIKAAIAFGIAEDIATAFVLQTFNGATALANNSSLSCAQLRKTVTSTGGTTAAAIEVFERYNFEVIVGEAMKAAYERAQQLGE